MPVGYDWFQSQQQAQSRLPQYLQQALNTRPQPVTMGNWREPQTNTGLAQYVSQSGPQPFDRLLDMYNRSLGQAPAQLDESELDRIYKQAAEAARRMGTLDVRAGTGERGFAPDVQGIEQQQLQEFMLPMQMEIARSKLGNLQGGLAFNQGRLGKLYETASGPESSAVGFDTRARTGFGGSEVRQNPIWPTNWSGQSFGSGGGQAGGGQAASGGRGGGGAGGGGGASVNGPGQGLDWYANMPSNQSTASADWNARQPGPGQWSSWEAYSPMSEMYDRNAFETQRAGERMTPEDWWKTERGQQFAAKGWTPRDWSFLNG